MNGYGSHTFMWINAAGKRFQVKYHFHTEQGMAFFSNKDAAEMPGRDAGRLSPLWQSLLLL